MWWWCSSVDTSAQSWVYLFSVVCMLILLYNSEGNSSCTFQIIVPCFSKTVKVRLILGIFNKFKLAQAPVSLTMYRTISLFGFWSSNLILVLKSSLILFHFYAVTANLHNGSGFCFITCWLFIILYIFQLCFLSYQKL